MTHFPTPGTEPQAADDGVRFSLTIDDVVQKYCISHEALEDHFGDATGRLNGGTLATFYRNQDQIYAKAVAKLGAAVGIGNGSRIGLLSNDFK
ncbi:DUF1488 family protein [Paraburkholderia sp. BCC1884]|uniref:DUF1488 family protein n=1 Tax=Paraburkholderia sp. BCC1884 TaxID=2562668 RepID=UPI0011836BA0|nr:DUF1488 family protein [Paraburkholderia sp. BCC1884]